jgi:ribosomal protein S18 acetylase RimI-like enzyme
VRIRRFSESDLEAAAAIHSASFPRQVNSREWIACNARAYPRTRLSVADAGDTMLGFILWSEKSGFRAQVVLELEQIAVAPEHRNHGIGQALIRRSLSAVVNELAARSAMLKAVLISARTDNAGQRLYRRALGAEVVATVSSLYSGDEVFMLARQPPLLTT